MEFTILATIGGFLYYVLEILWRGHSHWTMILLGGICFTSVGILNEHISWNMPVELQMLSGGIIITILEFITGCIVNVWLGWNVWDYSSMPLNIMGQICLQFTGLWVLLSLIIIFLDDWLRYKLFHEKYPQYESIFSIK